MAEEMMNKADTKSWATISLKGLAMAEAVDAGLIQKGNGGYDIGPFLRFWDAFSKYLPHKGKERPNEMRDLLEMLNHEGEGTAGDDAQQS